MTALHQRLHFDTARGQVLDESRRYVLVRADVLMGAFDALPDAARNEALHALGRSVATHGVDSIRAYAAANGPETLPTVMERAAASLGWGRWTLEVERDALRLRVDNSPFAAASTRRSHPACHAIAGMLEGLAGVLWNGDASAIETACGAQHGGACHFVARRGDGIAV
jgi:predicted hydrocarbon binding protein